MDYRILENGELKPATLLEWAKWFETPQNRIIGSDFFDDDIHISTVCLGSDHGFGGRPLWFETMVFGGPLGGAQIRYETLEEAKQGHLEMVERIKAELEKV